MRSSSDLPGIYNAAPDGVLALSEIASLLGKLYVPLLPPWGTGLAGRGLGALGLHIPDEVRRQLRYGARAGQPPAQAIRLPVRADDARDRAGVRRGAAARAAAGERRGAISLRARGRGVPPLVAECEAQRESSGA